MTVALADHQDEDVLDRELRELLEREPGCEGYNAKTKERCPNRATWVATLKCCLKSQLACDTCKVTSEATWRRKFKVSPVMVHGCGVYVQLASLQWSRL